VKRGTYSGVSEGNILLSLKRVALSETAMSSVQLHTSERKGEGSCVRNQAPIFRTVTS